VVFVYIKGGYRSIQSLYFELMGFELTPKLTPSGYDI
jgi:hypothetical protein